MMNDRFPELRQHLLATADERPADDRLAAIVAGVATTAQRPAPLSWLTWLPRRLGPFPSAAVRYGLIVVALIIAAVAAVVFAGGPPRPSVDLGIFAPVAGRIVSGVWAVDPEAVDPSGTSHPTSLRTGPEEVLAVGWSSDGTELLFIRRDPTSAVPFATNLFILHADGTETQLTTDGMEMWGATIAPDGSRVVYAARDVDTERSVPPSLFAVDTTGGQPVRIAAEGEQPTFSPEGSHIAYAVNNAGAGHVWIADADGSDAHEILTDEPALLRGVDELRWSPTRDRIVMGDQGEGHVAIYTFAPDGSEFTKVIEGGMNAFWSPDGSQIAYLRPLGGPRAGLAIANADGSGVREFGFGASGPWHPGTPEDDVEEPTSPPPSTQPTSAENGLPLAIPYVFLDGAVTMSAADPWGMGLERWALELGDQAGEAIVLVADPRASGVGCGIGAFPVDADALARNLQLDPDLEVTAPVAVSVGGIDALRVDLVLVPGAAVCDGASPVLRLPGASDYSNDRQSASLAPGTRMRLYLVNLPEGSASRIMAIAIVAPEARFDSVLEAAAPIIDSIQFHAP